MAPSRPSKQPPTTEPSEARKTTDALWLFELFMNCDPPVILNVTGIAEKTDTKPNTIVKRINTFQHRYEGFGIVTRTTGSKQSSNVVAATASGKLVGKIIGGKAKSKGKRLTGVESEDDDEDDSGEEDSEKTKKTSSRDVKVKGKASDSKSKIDLEGKQIDVTKSDKAPRGVKPRKSRVSATPRKSVVDDDADNSGDDDVDVEPPTRKPATRKRMDNRKSAMRTKVDDLDTDYDEPVAKGRHVSPEKTKAIGFAEDGLVKAHTISNDNSRGGLKRKRAATTGGVSISPLTPSHVIEGRLADLGDVDPEDKDGTSQTVVYDTRPPPKKQKTKADAEAGKILSEEVAVHEPGASNIQQDVEDPIRECPATPNQPISRDTTTPPDHQIDKLLPSPEEFGDESDEEAGVEDIIQPPVSPTAGRGGSSTVKFKLPVDETVAPASSVGIAAEKITTAEVERHVDPFTGPSSIDEANTTALPTTEVFNAQSDRDGTDGTDVVNTDETVAEDDAESEGPQQPQSKKWFSQPLEWMVWNPNAKPAEPRGAFKLGRVLP